MPHQITRCHSRSLKPLFEHTHIHNKHTQTQELHHLLQLQGFGINILLILIIIITVQSTHQFSLLPPSLWFLWREEGGRVSLEPFYGKESPFAPFHGCFFKVSKEASISDRNHTVQKADMLTMHYYIVTTEIEVGRRKRVSHTQSHISDSKRRRWE